MPRLPDALGTPDPNGIAASDAAAQAGPGSTPDPAQPYDAISSILDGASTLYARFGQGGPPKLTAVAASNNGLATAPYGADVASSSGYVGNAPPSPLGLGAFASDLPQNSGTNSSSPVEPSSPGVPVVLPDGSRVPAAESATGFLMSPVADLSSVAAAGRNAGNTYLAMLNNPEAAESANSYLYASLYRHLSQGGTFDYQRQGNPITGFTQLRQFRDVSNFNIGLFSQQAGLTLDETLRSAGLYARVFSGNARPDRPYGLDLRNVSFIKSGYQAGVSGVFGPAAHW